MEVVAESLQATQHQMCPEDPNMDAADSAPNVQKRVKNNNHHVVPVGVLIVLFTLYLTATILHSSYANYYSKDSQTTAQDAHFAAALNAGNEQEQEIEEILVPQNKNLEEHNNVCDILEIFTDYMPITQQENFKISNKKTDNQLKPKKKQLMTLKSKRTKGSNGNGNGRNEINLKNGNKSVVKIKNGHIKNSESNKVKKETKKSTTAEPIIYLFALVFIYLLLKAASDINQHYKSQNKSDKRLRRCSLQSYAQAHKQDRRASKDSPLRHKHRLMEARSISMDRYKAPKIPESPQLTTECTEILSNFRKYTTVDTTPSAIISTDPIRSIHLDRRLAASLSNRRCSVPVTINYQTVQIAVNPNRPLLRRTSMIGSSTASLNIVDPMGSTESGLITEPKRRVRMINRH